MGNLIFITHPEVIVDGQTDVRRWRLSDAGIKRMRSFADGPVPENLTAIWSSTEAKAIESAGILAARLGLGIQVDEMLGENDRSATGFLPPAEFETVADAFFAEPQVSIRGWERAVDAQARVLKATQRILTGHDNGDIALVAHGAVGSLLLCALLEKPISRAMDQPHQGHFWTAALPNLRVIHDWKTLG